MSALAPLMRLFGSAEKDDPIRRQLAEFRRSLAPHLDCLDFLDGVIPLCDGRVVVPLLIHPFAADALTNAQKNAAFIATKTAIGRWPENTRYQIWHRNWYATEEDIRRQLRPLVPSGNPAIDRLARHKVEYYVSMAKQGFLYEPLTVLFATFRPSPQWELDTAELEAWTQERAIKNGFPGTRQLVRRFRAEHERMLSDVLPQVDLIASQLRAAGVETSRLPDDRSVTLLFQALNPNWRHTGPRELDRRYQTEPFDPAFYLRNPAARPASAREQLIFSDVILRTDHLEIDGVLTRSLYMKKLPSHAVPGMVEALTAGLHFEYTLSVNIEILDKATELAKIRARKQRHVSGKRAFLGSIELPTEESRLAAEQMQDLIYATLEHRDRPLNAGIVISFEGKDNAELRHRTNQVITQMSQMQGAETFLDRTRQFQTWLSNLPAHGQKDQRLKETTQTCAASLMPLYGRYRGTTGWPVRESDAWPVIVGVNDRGEVVTIDPLQLRSPHGTIQGATGSGKTTKVIDMINRHLVQPDAMTIVFDATEIPYRTEAGIGESAGSYERVAKCHGAELVAVSVENMPNFNPFALRMRDEDIGTTAAERKEIKCDSEGVPLFAYQQCLKFVEALIVDEQRPRLDKPTRGLLLAVLKSLMRTWDNPDDPPYMPQFLKELWAFAQTEPRAKECFEALYQYGPDTPLGWHLSPQNEPFQGLKNRMCVFDLARLKEFGEDAAAVMMLVTNWTDRELMRASNRRLRKQIIGDEIREYINDGPSALAFGSYAARMRKHRGYLLYVGQDHTDFSTSSVGARLVANTGIKMFFGLEDRGEEYRKFYGLTPADMGIINSLGGSGDAGDQIATRSAFVKVGRKRSRLSFPLDPVAYYQSTSHGPDVELMRALQLVYGVPGRDLDYVTFFERVARQYPPGWTVYNSTAAEIARIERAAARAKTGTRRPERR